MSVSDGKATDFDVTELENESDPEPQVCERCGGGSLWLPCPGNHRVPKTIVVETSRPVFAGLSRMGVGSCKWYDDVAV
jgi:hypothetical protein